ncbi:ubiquitin-like-conjugating enzyme ATG10 isoform X3 [Ictalurus punctatus]|uniref:Ubiquitin-like-conjugating enzyme ATG10 n=1 Tax=Ictalurus punctatus TaxID=7998 RepID=A0A979F953_ICTPU|nr:ubiquitin-like-conjugating enzyme ATG10 isoform X3 [Ictalurus punctatus]
MMASGEESNISSYYLDEKAFHLCCKLFLQHSGVIRDGWSWAEVKGGEEGYIKKTAIMPGRFCSLLNHNADDKMSALTQADEEHPLLGQPFFMLHPCHTEELMRPLIIMADAKKRWSTEVSMQLKNPIIKLKNKTDLSERQQKLQEWPIQQFGTFLRKEECTAELSNTKRPGRPQKTTKVDDHRILSWLKKNPFTTSKQVKNTLEEESELHCHMAECGRACGGIGCAT